MTTIYKVRAGKTLTASDPLHVSRFYSPERLHRAKMQDRQDLILYLGQLHSSAMAHCLFRGRPRNFCEVEMRLMSLRDWVHDYRVALDHFFDVKKTGFNFGDGQHEVSVLVPKNLGFDTMLASASCELSYLPPERPDVGVVSKVYIQQHNAVAIRQLLADESRADLSAAAEWLLSQPEVNFTFIRSGKLQQRDTSVWPVAAIETWPARLRELLFGQGIDIESAYTQYLVSTLSRSADERHLALLYPDLLRSVSDKQQWRHELCTLLGLAPTDANIGIVKKICMSLANGSRISPGILSGGGGFSVTAEIIIQSTQDLSEANLDRIGSRLRHISTQYSNAKRAVCISHHGHHPSRRNQKAVFASYFEWERVARYAIWEAVGRHGLMVHDGIDGIPAEFLADIPAMIEKIGLKVTT